MSIGNVIVDHWGAIAGTGGGFLAFNAAVAALPPKDTKISSFKQFLAVSYGFIYDFLHNFASFRSGSSNPSALQNPTGPVTPAPTK
jgi:hypothetical protein